MAAMQSKRQQRKRQGTCCYNNERIMVIAWTMIVFVVVAWFGWGRAISQLLVLTTTSTTSVGSTTGGDRINTTPSRSDASLQQQQPLQRLDTTKAQVKAAAIATIHDFRKPPEVLLSSPQRGTTITADVRGNLGPPEVMIATDGAGSDWIKDRWQAASDMHGTAIKGSHWVRLHFTVPLHLSQITRIVLDWETAYAQDYRIDALYRNEATPVGGATCLYDYAVVEHQKSRITSRSYGQSPGVKQKLPLHVIHEISIPQQQQQQQPFDELLLTIRKPFHGGWGVSLWKIEVYGLLDHDNNAIAAAADQTTTAIA